MECSKSYRYRALPKTKEKEWYKICTFVFLFNVRLNWKRLVHYFLDFGMGTGNVTVVEITLCTVEFITTTQDTRSHRKC